MQAKGMDAVQQAPNTEINDYDGDQLNNEFERTMDLSQTRRVEVSQKNQGKKDNDEKVNRNIQDHNNTGEQHDFHLIFGAVEAQWVLSVLDDCMAKLNIASYLTSSILRDKIVDAVDHDLIIALKEHFQLEKEFVDIRNKMSNSSSTGSKEEAEQKKVLKELDMCLSDSTKTVCRLLQQNSIVVRRLREMKGKRAPGALEFMQVFSRLRKLVHHKLKMTAEEERAMNEQLQDLIVKEQEDTQKFLQLTERLQEERTEHTQSISVKDQKIFRLNHQIDDLETKTKRERTQFSERMRAEEEMARDLFTNTELELSKQLNILETKLSTESKENWHDEHLLHRQREHKADYVQDKIKMYDSDMKEKHLKLLELQKMYEEESEELKKLTEYFTIVDTENQRLEDEANDIRARRDEQLVMERRTHYSAVLIQKLFKAFQVRETKRKKKEAEALQEDDKKKK